MGPYVAIVGRANVGKSTLFNRLTKSREAIVQDESGITRDRIYRQVEWAGKAFTLVDTGGLEPRSDDRMTELVSLQTQQAIAEADLLLFMVDAQTGITSLDEEVADLLHRSKKPTIVVANKMDDFSDVSPMYEFYGLGFERLVPVSASLGTNTGDLLDAVIEGLAHLPPGKEAKPDTTRIAVVGRPNVGKSSLVNVLIGHDRAIVSDVPGTTRDALDTPFRYKGKDYVLVDTAGMRKRKQIDEVTEHFSVLRSVTALERADLVLMVIDADQGLLEQDKRIAGMAHEQGKGLILLVNKWDLVEKDQSTMATYEKALKEELAFMAYAPIVFVSALTKQRTGQIMETVEKVAANRLQTISTGMLNEIIHSAILRNPPASVRGKRLKIYYATQTATAPPTFALFVNNRSYLHFSYARYLENRIRDHFDFEGTTIVLKTRNRKEGDRE